MSNLEGAMTMHLCRGLEGGSIQVVAEISQRAWWLVEDMKLSEEQVELSKWPLCPKCGAPSNEGFCPYEIECEIDKRRVVAYIQCPHCKSYQ